MIPDPLAFLDDDVDALDEPGDPRWCDVCGEGRRPANLRPRPSVADLLRPDEDAPDPVRQSDRSSSLRGGAIPTRKPDPEAS